MGSTSYYPQFEFRPAAEFNLFCEYPVAPEHFMVLELQLHGLEGCCGLTHYHRLFNEVDV